MEDSNSEGDQRVSGSSSQIDSPSIARSPRAVAAFVGRTERGPVNEPTLVNSYNHFRVVFGGHAPFSHLSHVVQHFFLHGGKNAVVVRVVNRANRALIRIPAADEFLEIAARQPGSREFLRASVDYDGVESSRERFNLIVQRVSRLGSALVEDQEIFAGISVRETDVRYAGKVLAKSRLVSLRGDVPEQRPNATSPENPGDPVRYLEIGVRGSDGSELSDYDIIGSDRDHSGLWSLDAFERIDLLCLPPPPGRDHGVTTFLAAERYCERRRAMLIWDPPLEWTTADSAIIGAREGALRSSSALTYFPRIRPRVERVGLPSILPACGAIAGVLSSKGDFGDWQESSTTDPFLKISLAPVIEVEDAKRASLHRAGVNVLAASGYGGAAFSGNVTLAAPGSMSMMWQKLDRRRLAQFILSSIESAGDQAIARSEDPGASLESAVSSFLHDLSQRGAFAAGTDEEAFVVKRLPRTSKSLGERVRVGFALHRPAEFLLYDFTLTRAGCHVQSARALEADQLAG